MKSESDTGLGQPICTLPYCACQFRVSRVKFGPPKCARRLASVQTLVSCFAAMPTMVQRPHLKTVGNVALMEISYKSSIGLASLLSYPRVRDSEAPSSPSLEQFDTVLIRLFRDARRLRYTVCSHPDFLVGLSCLKTLEIWVLFLAKMISSWDALHAAYARTISSHRNPWWCKRRVGSTLPRLIEAISSVTTHIMSVCGNSR